MRNNPLTSLSDNVCVDKEKCIGCGICVDRCILGNLRLKQAPCQASCPLGINAQGYVQLIARGDVEQAAEQVYKKTPFLGMLGYVCNHPCEKECNRLKVDNEAVSIRSLKRFLAEKAGEPKLVEKKPAREEKVAVIGGGPAGMMAAYDLALAGIQVNLYEANDKLGGMPAKAIPAFRLPTNAVEKDTKRLADIGVSIHLNHKVDADMLEKMTQENDAVFLATGAHIPLSLPRTPEAQNVIYALDYLEKSKKDAATLTGNVVVIGGGDVAVDSALTAVRQGATVTILCLENEEDVPATKESIEEASQAGVVWKYGFGDSEFEVSKGNANKITAKRCVRVFDEEGRFSPRFDANESIALDVDAVVLAIGQNADLDYVSKSDITLQNTVVQVHPVSLQTSKENVFAGGDMVVGARTVVQAMADGKRAAQSILLYLAQDDLVFGRQDTSKYLHDFEPDLEAGSKERRIQLANPPTSPTLERNLEESEAANEASRCLNCGSPEGYQRTCWMCLPCEVECPQKALEIKIHYCLA